MLFERIGVHGLYIAEQPLLAAHAANKATCLVADFGSDCIDICPVLDGRAVPAHGRRLRHCGGLHATRSIATNMGLSLADAERVKLQAGISVPSRGVKRQTDLMMPTMAKMDPKQLKEDQQQQDDQSYHHENQQQEQHTGNDGGDAPSVQLPDGQHLRVPQDIRRASGDAMMQCSPSPAEEATGVINASPAEFRQQLCENVLAVGGCAGAEGLQDRLVEDMQEQLPPNSRRTEGIHGAEYMPTNWQQCASWLGGAILAKVVFSQNLHCSKFDYAEMGPTAIWRKT